MLKIILIRHGATEGNLKQRYVGTTEEEILEESRDMLEKKHYPAADIVYVSPMLRCRQTASTIYPDQDYIVVDDFRECDFGDFEGKNWKELEKDSKYQQWIDSDGKQEFPNGEHPQEFKDRCIDAFYEIIVDALETYRNKKTTIAVVAHGGTIMSIMEYFMQPKSEFYDWRVANGCGYVTVCLNENELRLDSRI